MTLNLTPSREDRILFGERNTEPVETDECTNCGDILPLDELAMRYHGYWCGPCEDRLRGGVG